MAGCTAKMRFTLEGIVNPYVHALTVSFADTIEDIDITIENPIIGSGKYSGTTSKLLVMRIIPVVVWTVSNQRGIGGAKESPHSAVAHVFSPLRALTA